MVIHKGTIMWSSRVSLIQLSQVMNNLCICQPTTFPAISRLQIFFLLWKANSRPNFNYPMISLQHGRAALIGNFMPSQKHSKSQDKKLHSPSILNDFRLMKCICHKLWQENTTKAFSSHKKNNDNKTTLGARSTLWAARVARSSPALMSCLWFAFEIKLRAHITANNTQGLAYSIWWKRVVFKSLLGETVKSLGNQWNIQASGTS